MRIQFNIRGNGACPLCVMAEKCAIRISLEDAVRHIKDPDGHEMELVIYKCPRFQEKF